MPKSLSKKRPNNPKRALIVKKIADNRGISTSYVYKIISGDRENDEILADYMDLSKGIDLVFNHVLVDAVEKLVPFNKPSFQ